MARTECSGIFLVIRRFNNIEDTLEFANNLPVFTIYINMDNFIVCVLTQFIKFTLSGTEGFLKMIQI